MDTSHIFTVSVAVVGNAKRGSSMLYQVTFRVDGCRMTYTAEPVGHAEAVATAAELTAAGWEDVRVEKVNVVR